MDGIDPNGQGVQAPRRKLGGVALLLLVAMAISAGLSPAQWSQAVGTVVGETAALAQRLSGAIAQVPQRPVVRVRIRPPSAAAPVALSGSADPAHWCLASDSGRSIGLPRDARVTSIERMITTWLSLPPPLGV